MDIGGNREKRSDKDDRKKQNKGKRKVDEEEEIPEEEKPRNRKYMDDEKKAGKRVQVSDDGDDCPPSWDWRKYAGITSNALKQKNHLICWAIAFIRAVEALFNIGRRLEEQRSFSIQHLVNNMKIGALGLKYSKSIGEFVEEHGILEEGECSYTRAKGTCAHDNPKTERIDRFVLIKQVDDVELAKLVWKHPVVGVVPVWWDFHLYRNGIYTPNESQTPRLHAVLIVGYDIDEHGRYYWIIQNSDGSTWGQEGFGFLHREHIRGRRSLFVEVYYGEKMGYPQKKKK